MVFISQHTFPAFGKEDLVFYHVPIPQTGTGSFNGSAETIFTFSKPFLGLFLLGNIGSEGCKTVLPRGDRRNGKVFLHGRKKGFEVTGSTIYGNRSVFIEIWRGGGSIHLGCQLAHGLLFGDAGDLCKTTIAPQDAVVDGCTVI